MKTCVKTIVLSALSALVVFTGMTYTSCNPDKCKAITCAYGGVCTNGECTCATGYEGNQCEKVTRDKFTGTWEVAETGTQTGFNRYTISIAPAEAIQEVGIFNFYNYIPMNLSVIANVSNDTLYIPRQELFNRTIEGMGYLDPTVDYEENGHMILRYRVTETVSGVYNDFGLIEGQPSLWYRTSDDF